MNVEFEALKNAILHKKLDSVYFLHGDEPYFIDAISDLMETSILNADEREFNQTVLYGKDVDMSIVMSHAKRFPMGSDKQVVIVKEAQDIKDLLPKESENSAKKKNQFLTYLSSPQPSTVLVFCYKHKKIDSRTSFSKNLSQFATVFKADNIKDQHLVPWINKYVQQLGYNIQPEASQIIAGYVGNEIGRIVNEIGKLTLLIPKGDTLTEKLITENISPSKDYSIFEFQSAIAKKDILKANRILKYFEQHPKEHPVILIIVSLFGFFNKLIEYQLTEDKKEAASKMSYFQLKDCEIAAKHYSFAKSKQVMSELRVYDMYSKGMDIGSTDQFELIKELLFKILH